MSHAVEVEGLCFDYGKRRALDGVSFVVEEGTVFGLLGPNGGGKSTLFKVLATIVPPGGGSARVAGRDVSREADAVRRRIGVVFQAPSLDKKLTVRENLRYQGRLYGLGGPELDRRIGTNLERVRLADRAHDLVEKLSGGQQRRVELAKGLLHEPPVLLLDEPSTGLDPAARRELMQHLQRLAREERRTILLTTHLLDEAEDCAAIGILHEGKLVALDAPSALRARVGGEILTIGADDPGALADAVKAKLHVEPQVLDGSLRIERERSYELIAPLMESFSKQITSLQLARPTLEDVFFIETGLRFEEVDRRTAAEQAAKKKRGHR